MTADILCLHRADPPPPKLHARLYGQGLAKTGSSRARVRHRGRPSILANLLYYRTREGALTRWGPIHVQCSAKKSKRTGPGKKIHYTVKMTIERCWPARPAARQCAGDPRGRPPLRVWSLQPPPRLSGGGGGGGHRSVPDGHSAKTIVHPTAHVAGQEGGRVEGAGGPPAAAGRRLPAVGPSWAGRVGWGRRAGAEVAASSRRPSRKYWSSPSPTASLCVAVAFGPHPAVRAIDKGPSQRPLAILIRERGPRGGGATSSDNRGTEIVGFQLMPD